MCQNLPKSLRVISMSKVLRVLVLRAIEWDKHENLSLEQKYITNIIYNDIRLAPEEALHLPIPKTDRVTSR